ncbi:hypothetical protein ACFWGE_13750 [Streptomyces bacillaris]|uniref:Uncharacterized protein n=1 Tax=Streptomyces cavourensis TaxID=67258 RepID=A0ABY5EZ96_9ACTN|nr:hypothetical protein [Streptomyces cavourensis]MBH0245989.1 hypothetical protein [Streptomyces cavourensis]UTR77153.1 hypothetical protein NLU04_00990 [Streptomyces cavourensis]
MMTIKVYAVNREGDVRVLRERAEVVPLDEPDTSQRLPACGCPRCAESEPELEPEPVQ